MPSPDPAGSFPGGFRTPTLGAARYVSTGRHPKPYTRAAVSHSVSHFRFSIRKRLSRSKRTNGSARRSDREAADVVTLDQAGDQA